MYLTSPTKHIYDQYLVNYIPYINKQSCAILNINPAKVCNYLYMDTFENHKQTYFSVYVAVSAAVTT